MDVEKTIQFLLEQQARFDARQAQFVERQAQFDERHSQFLASQAAFLNRQKRFEDELIRVHNILLEVATSQARTNELLRVLAEKQVETEQNLNALISTVERHIANHD